MSDAVILIECPCGHASSDPLSEFRGDDKITQCPDKHVVVECPGCLETRKTEEFARIWGMGDTPWYRLVLDEKMKPTSGKNPFKPLMTDQNEPTTSPCDTCGTPLSNSHKEWSDSKDCPVYDCPNCPETQRI